MDDQQQVLDDISAQLQNMAVDMGDFHTDIDHVSGQLDVLNHSLYVTNSYLMYTTVSVCLMAALLMFLIGYMITKGK